MVVGIIAGQVGEDMGEGVVDMILPWNPAPVVLAVLDRGRGEGGRDFKDGPSGQQVTANWDR